MRSTARIALAVMLGTGWAAGSVVAQDTTVGRPAAILVSGPRMGDRAPDFSLPWSSKDSLNGDPWFSLSAQRGKAVVLAFYPKDFTPSCTAEMKTFADQFQDLFGNDVVVVGINADSLTTHQRFAQSLGLPFRLLTDRDQRVSNRYGSADENGYNRSTIYVIDRKGLVAYTDLRFRPLESKSYSELKSAIRDALRD